MRKHRPVIPINHPENLSRVCGTEYSLIPFFMFPQHVNKCAIKIYLSQFGKLWLNQNDILILLLPASAEKILKELWITACSSKREMHPPGVCQCSPKLSEEGTRY